MATASRAAATRRARTRQEHPPIAVDASSVESFPEAELPEWDDDEELEMGHKMAAGTRLDASMESQVSQKKKGGFSHQESSQDGQGLHQLTQQEGAALGGDGGSGRLANTRDDSQLRCMHERLLGDPRTPGVSQVEDLLLDASSSSRLHSLQSELEAPSSLVGKHAVEGAGGSVGASGRGIANLERAARAAPPPVIRVSEASTEMEAHSKRPWRRGQVQKLKHSIKQVQRAMDHLTLVAKSSQPCWKVLEVFGGSAALSLIARETGQWVALEPVDLIYGTDLLSAKEHRILFEQLDRWEPDLVCLEPPCGPWSPLQNLNDQQVVDFKCSLHMPFWDLAARVWKKQDSAGRLVLLEQPLLSAALKLDCMQSRSNVHRAVVDQCRFGLKDPQSGLLYRKRTALDVNSEIFAVALMRNGRCCHAPREHQSIEGQTTLDGRSVSRSLVAGTWTPLFGKHILACAALAHAACWVQSVNGIRAFVSVPEGVHEEPAGFFLEEPYGESVCGACYELSALWCSTCNRGWCAGCVDDHACFVTDTVRQTDEHLAYALTDEPEEAILEDDTAPPLVKADLEVARLFRHLQQKEEERKGDYGGIGSRYGYVSFGGVSLRVNKAIRNQVAKLHGTLGHPSNDRLARMLHLQGAKKEVVQAARDLRCEVCARVHPPQSAPQSTATNPERFNAHVSGDSFFFLDANHVRWSVTHLVDAFCSLHTALLSKNPAAKHSCELLFERWALVYGPMKKLSVDGGPEFRGQFGSLCQLYDIHLDILPPGAKWKNGLAERHGGLLKLMMLKVVHELVFTSEPDLRYALAMCVQAKNRLMRRCGKSPIQVVQGRDEPLPSSLVAQIDRGEIKHSTNSRVLESEEQGRMERIRQEAAAAFHWLDAHERIRMALHSRSRPPHLRADALVPGTVVYFFKQPGQYRRMQDYATAYQGPAIVACADGPTKLWVRYKGSVVRVAIENVRLATPEEEMSTSYILGAMKALEEELTGQRRAPGYEEEEEEMQEGEQPVSPPPPGPLVLPPVQAPGGAPPEIVDEEGTDAAGPQESGQGDGVQATLIPEPSPEVVTLARQSADQCRMLDGLPPKFRAGPYDDVHRASVPKKITFFEQGGKEDTWQEIPGVSCHLVPDFSDLELRPSGASFMRV